MSINIHISNSEILNEEKAKLFEVNLEDRLKFDFHVNTLLNKTSKKYHALATLCNNITKQGGVLMNSFITSQFCYCLLI